MNLKILQLFLTLFLIGNVLLAQKNSDQIRVLVLFSYEEIFPTYKDINRSINEFTDSLNYDFETFYMDTKYRTDSNYIIALTQLLQEKLTHRDPFQAIVTVDDNALHFAISERERLLGDIPIIFLGLNDVEFAKSMNHYPSITGVTEAVSIGETIRLMQDLQPNLKNIYVISDNTETAQSDLISFNRAIATILDLKFTVINTSNYSFDEFYDQIGDLKGEKNAILLLAAYKDKNNNYMSFRQISDKLIEKSRIPIYHIYKHGVGDGFVGGVLVSHYEQARIALTILHQIKQGKKIENIPVIAESPNVAIVDVSAIQKYNIPEDNIPKGVLKINPPSNSITINKQYYQWLIWICITLLFLISFGLLLVRKLTNRNRHLKKDKELYLRLFSESPIPMFIINPLTLIITDVNIAATKLYGYTYDEFKKLPINNLNHLPEKKLRGIINNILNKSIIEINMTHYKKNGQELLVEIHTGPFLFKGQNMVYTVIFDLTEQKYMENSLRQALDQAQENELLKLSFLRTMNHEVRTPLNGVMGFTELLLNKTKNDELSSRYGMYIRSCSEKLVEIIDNVLDLSLIENNQTQIYLSSFNIIALIDELFEQQHPNFESKKIRFVKQNINIANDEIMHSDKGKISKIIHHLLNNALKFTDKGTVEIIARKTDNVLIITIKDSGIGIEEKNQEIIFNRFRQVELSDTAKYGGTGIGLAIVKEYTTMLSGNIIINSEFGKGSSFILQIPLKTDTVNSTSTKNILDISIN